MWCGSDCRDLVFHAIEPLDKMGKLRCGIALHVLDLTRKFGDRAVRVSGLLGQKAVRGDGIAQGVEPLAFMRAVMKLFEASTSRRGRFPGRPSAAARSSETRARG